MTKSQWPSVVVGESFIRAPDDGWMFHPKHVQPFAGNKILYKKVSSCWNILKNVNEGVMRIFAYELIDLDINVKKFRPDESPYWNCFHSYNTVNSFIMQ
jgi:hypothetical protein